MSKDLCGHHLSVERHGVKNSTTKNSIRGWGVKGDPRVQGRGEERGGVISTLKFPGGFSNLRSSNFLSGAGGGGMLFLVYHRASSAEVNNCLIIIQ